MSPFLARFMTEAISLLADVRNGNVLLKRNEIKEIDVLIFIIVVVGKSGFISSKTVSCLRLWSRVLYFNLILLQPPFQTPEVGLCLFWNSAKAEYFKNKKNFMLRKPD